MIKMKKKNGNTEVKVLDNGTVMKVQKTRQRKVLSCMHCHSKKIKCSRAQPVCNNCQKLNIECKYFVNERVSRGGKKKGTVSALEKENIGNRAMLKNSSHAIPLSQRNNSVSSYSDNSTSSPKSRISTDDTSINNDDISLKNVIPQISMSFPFDGPSQASISQQGSSPCAHPDQKGTGKDIADFTIPFKSKRTGEVHSNNVHTPAIQTPIPNNISGFVSNTYTNEDQFQFNLSSFTFNPEHLIISSERNSPFQNNRKEQIKEEKKDNSLSNYFSQKEAHQNETVLKGISNIDQNGYSNSNSNYSSSEGANLVNFSKDGNETINAEEYQSSKRNAQPENPGLYNSLTAYLSNPATTVNYLYGTNTYYASENLLEDLVQFLPSTKERSYELISRYINSVHILLPIIVNIKDFVQEHDRFWSFYHGKDRRSSENSDDKSKNEGYYQDSDFNYLQFYTLYFPVLYAATISEFEEYDNLLLNQDIDRYLRAFNKICQYYNYPQGLKSIPLLLGNVIIQSTSPNPSTMEMAQIIRYAKLLQLHKDPVKSLRISDWEVVKFRRLFWWVIFGLDALTSHNFCLPPICKFDDFNVLMPDEDEPIFSENGQLKEKKLNVSMLAMKIKFSYDRILSELVYQINNGLSTNITPEEIKEIKCMITSLYKRIQVLLEKMTNYYHKSPPQTVQEVNVINFIRNHSSSYVDRATMLLHKKILLRDTGSTGKERGASVEDDMKSDEATRLGTEYQITEIKKSHGLLSLSHYEDTFGHIEEANIVANLNNSSISQLKFNEKANFSYESLSNNLIPSILHNLNDFLKYNDFMKFGKFNWFVKRTIPLDSIILMFIIIIVKFKYEFLNVNELVVYVKLINKALFILNRKYFKNEKYKRMLSLTNQVWKFILEKHKVLSLISKFTSLQNGDSNSKFRIEFFDYQVSEYMNMNELFDTMDVPQPFPPDGTSSNNSKEQDDSFRSNQRSLQNGLMQSSILLRSQSIGSDSVNDININEIEVPQFDCAELLQLSEKIYYDLRNNFVDINDYCPFYSSLENVLQEIMNYMLS